MKTPRVLAPTVVVAASFVLLAACGGSGPEVASDPVGSPSTEPVVQGIEHPTGADDVLLSIETGGGFVPVEYALTAQPTLLLTGDGRLLRPPSAGKQARLIPMSVAQLSEEQVQDLLGLAEDAGLLAPPPDYIADGGAQIADAPTTTVTIAAAGDTWSHAAYALGFDAESGPRQALSGFVDAASAAVAEVEAVAFEPAEVELFVQQTDLEREVVAWPRDDVSLADVSGCVAVPAGDLVSLLSSTSLLATFSQAGALYSVSASEVLPGDEPCRR